jgi:hypothetical protein
MRWLRGTAATTAALAVVMGVMVVTTSSVAAEPAGCAAKNYLGEGDVLRPGRALCSGNYLLRMQENGDLVLREISTGRACWHSQTYVPGVAATFLKGGVPPANVTPTLRIGTRDVFGMNGKEHIGSTANINSKGELWVGYGMVVSC